MLGSDEVSRCGLVLETSHFSSLSLEGLRSWSAKIWLSKTLVNQRVFGLLYLQIRNNESR